MSMMRKFKTIHFVGIGGIGMSGIAEVLINQGFTVTGSDNNLSDITDYLEKKGAKIFSGNVKEKVGAADVLFYFSAVTPENPEVIAAYDSFLFNAALAELRTFNLTGSEAYLKEFQQRQPEDDEVQRILEFVNTYKTRPVDMQLKIFVGSISER